MINTPHDVILIGIVALFALVALEIFKMIERIINKKNDKFNLLFFYILVIAWGSFTYNDIKEELATAFENNQELLCNTSPKVLISKNVGYMLKHGMFIKDGKIIDIDYCGVFE